MENRKVMSVFDGNQMQKYFLLLTKEAEEAAYEVIMENNDYDLKLEDFLKEVKNSPHLKKVIQEMLLISIKNVDWKSSLRSVISNNLISY